MTHQEYELPTTDRTLKPFLPRMLVTVIPQVALVGTLVGAAWMRTFKGSGGSGWSMISLRVSLQTHGVCQYL